MSLFKRKPAGPIRVDTSTMPLSVRPFFGISDPHLAIDAIASNGIGGLWALMDNQSLERQLSLWYVAATDWKGSLQAVSDWTNAHPEDGPGWALRSATERSWAFQQRGSGPASEVTQTQADSFRMGIESSQQAAQRAADLAADHPLVRFSVVLSMTTDGIDHEEARFRYERLIEAVPNDFFGAFRALQFWCAKWYGSTDLMFDFARRAAHGRPDGSPHHALPAMAHLERLVGLPRDERTQYEAESDVQNEASECASRLWNGASDSDGRWLAENIVTCLLMRVTPEQAAAGFDRIGDKPTELPWSYFGADAFQRAATSVRGAS